MRAAFLVLAAALLAGCATGGDDAPTPTPTATAPTSASPAGLSGTTTVYQGTIAFSVETAGEEPLDVPPQARSLTLSVEWTSEAPVTTTANAAIEVRDAQGNVVLDCAQGVNVVSGSSSSCGPKTNDLSPYPGPYTLAWQGSGNVRADVTITAQ